MGNVLRVLWRDIVRLVKAPAALVVVVALLILPSVYTWYNVIGFWDPYGNTGNLRVYVVNEDEGASSSLTGELHVGDMIVEELHGNDQLDWTFSDRSSAMADLEAGKGYAVFVIPKDFTSDLLSLTTGDFHQPELEYYVNEKAGPVSPKITDTGATTLDETINSTFVSTVSDVAVDFHQPELEYYVNEKAGPVSPKITDTGATTLDETINSTFVSTVSDVAVKAIDGAMDESAEALSSAKSRVSDDVTKGVAAIADARVALGRIADATGEAQGKVAGTQSLVSQAKTDIDTASEALSIVSFEIVQLHNGITQFSAIAMPAVTQSLDALSSMSTKANAAVGSITSSFDKTQANITSSIAQGQAALNESKALAAYLRSTAEALPEGNVGSITSSFDKTQANITSSIAQGQAALNESKALAAYLRSTAEALPEGNPSKDALLAAVQELETSNANMQQRIDSLSALNAEAGKVNQSVANAAGPLNDAVQQAIGGAQSFSSTFFGTTVPTINQSLIGLSTTSSALATAVSNQKILVDQTSLLLDELSTMLETAKQAVTQTDGLLADVEQSLVTVQTDVLALSQSNALSALFGVDGLDAQKVASFMGAPTEVVTEQLYPLNAYGSAMAPLFMNLTFWIGAFMLLVIMKQEVDTEGIRNLTLSQRYLGRFALFAVFAVLQALICCAGVLFIGVEAVNVHALFFASAIASLAYLSIIYALSVTLQHIGKGLCVVLLFAQIPGATGLYPTELTASFFQAIYPLFPFTYGISAMREAICGFYGSQYVVDLVMLGVFFAIAMAVGLLVRPLLANVNRMVARQVKEGGIYNGEDVEIPARPYRVSQLFRALSEKEQYREEIRTRYERFTQWYPRLIRGSIVFGVGVPVVLTIVFALTPTEKVWLLTLWLVWIVVVFVFLIVVESLRYSIERQMQLDGMTDESLIGLYSARKGVERSGDGPSADEGCEGRKDGDGRA